jgi:hypothetical protein
MLKSGGAELTFEPWERDDLVTLLGQILQQCQRCR